MTGGDDRARRLAAALRPHVEQVIRDPDLRDDLLSAIGSARAARAGLRGSGGLSGGLARVLSDPAVRDDLRAAAAGARSAAARLDLDVQDRLRVPARSATIAAGAAAALLVNPVTGPAARRWVATRLLLRQPA